MRQGAEVCGGHHQAPGPVRAHQPTHNVASAAHQAWVRPSARPAHCVPVARIIGPIAGQLAGRVHWCDAHPGRRPRFPCAA
jgi:hypothetical protein